MAWPKGKKRSQVAEEKAKASQASQDRSGDTITSGLPQDIVAARRRICAHRVRRQVIPREIRIHDYLPLAKTAEVIRRQMAKDGAGDSEVERYVAQHVR